MQDPQEVRGEARPGPALPGLPELDPATVAVRDFIGSSRDLVVRMARVMAMNTNDMVAVSTLMFHGPMGASELAARLGITTASGTVLIDRLERAGQVERVRDGRDRRRVTVRETEAARQASMTAWLPGILELDEICRGLTDAEHTFAVDLLTRLTATLDRTGH